MDISERGDNLRVTPVGDDGTDDAHANRVHDVRDTMVQLQVHLDQGLLHMLDMCGRVFGKPFALAHVDTRQPIRIQLTEPVCIADIGFAVRHGISSAQGEGRGPCKFVIFLTEIAATAASPLSTAHQPMC